MADQGHRVHDLTPADVSKGMADGRYLLVDVREPNEVAVEAYPGAVVVPLHEASTTVTTNHPTRIHIEGLGSHRACINASTTVLNPEVCADPRSSRHTRTVVDPSRKTCLLVPESTEPEVEVRTERPS